MRRRAGGKAGRALACAGSVADLACAGRLVEACVDGFGSIDVLVSCAGIGEPEGSSFAGLASEAWREGAAPS